MDNLRLILLVCGVLLLAGIYFWGVAAARRDSQRKKSGDPEAEIENEIELLERFQDSRAARHSGALKELNQIDIDADLERPVPAEQGAERDPAANDYDAFEKESAFDREEARFRPVFAEDARDSASEDAATADNADLVASLSEIQATLAPDPSTQIDQLDLLREELDQGKEEEPEEKTIPRAEAREKPKQAPPKPAGKKEEAPQELVLAITVMAKEGQRFSGEALRHWLESLKLRHGEMGLFHYRPPGKPLRAPPTYSVSSVVKPGSFDVEQMEDITVPGIAMFVQLPGPDDPVSAFEEMLRAARKLAEGLGGTVCDETRSTLTGQVINHMRERIAEYSRRQRLRF
jgi:cell division protein ZipA